MDVIILSTPMPKQSRNNKKPQDGEEVEDIMAWGNRKENFYQHSDEQYSQSGEEEQEAQRLYDRQFEELGHGDLYELPQPGQHLPEEDEEEEDGKQATDSGLSRGYLTRQIAKTARLGLKISEETNSQARTTLETHIQTYLMALIGLRELQIPFIEHHPLFNKTIEMKQDITKLRRLLDTTTLQQESSGEEELLEEVQGEYADEEEMPSHDEEMLSQDEEMLSQEDVEGHPELMKNGRKRESDTEIARGMKIYEQTKKKQRDAKQVVKQQKRVDKQSTRKPAFLLVKGEEGRLASEKILKNKGLIKKRKKCDRNSRVKLRRKFDKATSKRRAYGHVIRENPGKSYEGQRNIKYGRIASVKLK